MNSTPRPLSSLAQIHRILDAESSYTLSRLRVLERMPGNPIGVEHRRIEDGVIAFMARHLPVPSFNTVVGLRAGHERHIEPLVAWYRENGLTGRFEMVPGTYDAALGEELARLGYYQSGFHAAMIAEPDAAAPGADGTVERVADATVMEHYLDAYVAGWAIPERDRDQFKQNVRPWREQPGWSLYVARIDGRPAAAATLYVHAKVGYCADGATDPAFRGRGLHAALLRRRMTDASAAGVDFVCSGAAFLSASHRNMERIGMRVAFIRSIWTAR
jgi:ribosomal protein S18 acetylase RimI-like enzyme